MAKQEKKEGSKAKEGSLDPSKDYVLIGTGKHITIGKGVEFEISGQSAIALIEKGFAKLK